MSPALLLLLLCPQTTPAGVAVSFISDPQGPPWIFDASFTSQSPTDPSPTGQSPTGPGPTSRKKSTQLRYRYRASAFLGERPPLDTTAAVSIAVGGHRDQRSVQFTAAPPLDGWPERDQLSLVWHEDGGLEVRLGGSIRLETGALRSAGAPGRGELLWVSAELFHGQQRRSGIAAVAMVTRGQAVALRRPGAMVLSITGKPGVLFRSGIASPWSWGLPVGHDQEKLDRSFSITWIDGIQSAGVLIPTAFRVESASSGLLLERADAASQESSEAGAPPLIPLVGSGYGDKDLITAVGFLVPPIHK